MSVRRMKRRHILSVCKTREGSHRVRRQLEHVSNVEAVYYLKPLGSTSLTIVDIAITRRKNKHTPLMDRMLARSFRACHVKVDIG